MQILSRGFSQRRKASMRPRDLHIRRVSGSGSSLSSGCSLSSSVSSASTARMPIPALPVDSCYNNYTSHLSVARTDSGVAFNPLQQHPSFAAAPARLSERAFLPPSPDHSRYEQAGTFFEDDSEDDGELEDEDVDELEEEFIAGDAESEWVVPNPDEDEERLVQHDFFLLQLARRPAMPRSHWSESTIMTLDQVASTPEEAVGAATAATALGNEPRLLPNFSKKRMTAAAAQGAAKTQAPSRPQMMAFERVEEFIKRGGWKRKGIVFEQDQGYS